LDAPIKAQIDLQTTTLLDSSREAGCGASAARNPRKP
jgi:hypothetical protein